MMRDIEHDAELGLPVCDGRRNTRDRTHLMPVVSAVGCKSNGHRPKPWRLLPFLTLLQAAAPFLLFSLMLCFSPCNANAREGGQPPPAPPWSLSPALACFKPARGSVEGLHCGALGAEARSHTRVQQGDDAVTTAVQLTTAEAH